MSKRVEFSIEHKQYLDKDGTAIKPLPSLSTKPKQLFSLYQQMLALRAFDTKTVALQRTGKMGTFPSSLGQEAVMIGIGNALQENDIFAGSYREQGIYFSLGIKMSEVLAYWGGDERGSNFSNGSRHFPICVPIATQCLHGAGAAYALKYRNQPQAVLTMIGDGGSSKGDFLEALNVAGAWELPIVFIICNNQWAISVPRQSQSATTMLAQKAIGAGIDGIQVDGNDLFAVYDTVDQALTRARQEHKPMLIEAVTYRLADHTTADDAKRYRTEEEVKQAWDAEPIKRLKQYLIDEHGWTEQQEQQALEHCTSLVEKAVEEYLNTSAEHPVAMIDHMFATLPTNLREQRDIINYYAEK